MLFDGWKSTGKFLWNADCNGESDFQRFVIVVAYETNGPDDSPGTVWFPEKLKGRKLCPELVELNSDLWRNRNQ